MTDDRPLDALAAQLDRIEATAKSAHEEARTARKESQATNGRLGRVEDDLYGPADTQRARHNTGLVGKMGEVREIVFDLARSRDESKAVLGARKEIRALLLAVIGLMIPAIGLLVMVVQG